MRSLLGFKQIKEKGFLIITIVDGAAARETMVTEGTEAIEGITERKVYVVSLVRGDFQGPLALKDRTEVQGFQAFQESQAAQVAMVGMASQGQEVVKDLWGFKVVLVVQGLLGAQGREGQLGQWGRQARRLIAL